MSVIWDVGHVKLVCVGWFATVLSDEQYLYWISPQNKTFKAPPGNRLDDRWQRQQRPGEVSPKPVLLSAHTKVASSLWSLTFLPVYNGMEPEWKILMGWLVVCVEGHVLVMKSANVAPEMFQLIHLHVKPSLSIIFLKKNSAEKFCCSKAWNS